MPEVTIYSTAFCPYCVRAKALLDSKGVSYREIRVDQDHAQMRVMIERSRRRTVPQIFIDSHHVGGYDDLAALDRAKRLDPLLQGLAG
ncbi:MAG: glutaredoxin 3 [Chromatiales bacterium]|nr:glutaredoxin 3 [Chromatiales bacterium]